MGHFSMGGSPQWLQGKPSVFRHNMGPVFSLLILVVFTLTPLLCFVVCLSKCIQGKFIQHLLILPHMENRFEFTGNRLDSRIRMAGQTVSDTSPWQIRHTSGHLRFKIIIKIQPLFLCQGEDFPIFFPVWNNGAKTFSFVQSELRRLCSTV